MQKFYRTGISAGLCPSKKEIFPNGNELIVGNQYAFLAAQINAEILELMGVLRLELSTIAGILVFHICLFVVSRELTAYA